MPESIALRAARAAEEACQRLGMGPRIERVVALAVAIVEEPEPIEGLTRTEAHIAQILQAAAGRTVAIGHLTDAICVEDGTIKTHVCRLRKRRPDLAERIETVWGVGYRWRP